MIKFFEKINKELRENRAFTLVESLVAISIFTVSLLTLMIVLGGGVSNINYVKEKIIATYLAQEGIEYVRNMEDTFILYSATSQTGWDAFNNKLLSGNALCEIPAHPNGCYFYDGNLDYTSQNNPITQIPLTACNGSCPVLLYNPSTGKYNYSTGSTCGFTRKIQATIINANETKIMSTVFWVQGSGTYSTSFSESLFKWVE